MSAELPLALRLWRKAPLDLLPFADAARGLPAGRLARLALVQVSVGLGLVLLNGTLNRVMIVEIGVPAWQVALFIALPLLLAPLRAVFGLKSDQHRSVLGWRRVPYIWFGSLTLFGGLALTPMSITLLTGDGAQALAGRAGVLVSFFLIGMGTHVTQTAGLALACDLAPQEQRPRVVALLYVVLLLAMASGSLIFGATLHQFSYGALFATVGYTAILAFALNVVALWKQERRGAIAADEPRLSLREAWRGFDRGGRARRLLVAVMLVTAGFNMQDVLLEPYGGEVLGLTVGATTSLTAIWALGTLGGFALAARGMSRGTDSCLLAARGVLIGIPAFSLVIFAGPFASVAMFIAGVAGIGLGGGIASVSLLAAATALAETERFGFAMGVWGAAQALAVGLAVGFGGAIRDAADAAFDLGGRLDATYGFVYHVEIALLFAALVALGPLASRVRRGPARLAIQEFPA
ncbi:MFS transporter [Aurantiacibacter spongiae]|uniref:MFS transporter n=1 Tax=Aurantiacibacter spongiae TaxID=2488860 RepID=A0A3N5DAP6_9SPHN|nr:MFS transporter [Aurantiacibacter spongiae]RPF71768.1 MFS transporter [Aurantiacibacter spongiae]